MRTKLTFLFLILVSSAGFGQSELSHRKQMKAYQVDQNESFRNERLSPLPEKELEQFDQLLFFRPKSKYRVLAQMVRTPETEPFEMPTTTERRPVYQKYGELHFKIRGQKFLLNVYQSLESRRNPLLRNRLFLPFKDRTNSKKTYGGGRFIDITIPKEDVLFIDFNKAYNPYCLYDVSYSCPVVPIENYLDIRINAGIKAEYAVK